MQRTLIIGGREIPTMALGQPLDQAFDRLHAAYFGNTPLQWQEFEAAAIEHFTAAPDVADKYFTTFSILWRSLLDAGNYRHAEHIWERALQPALSWEQAAPGRRLHKGTPYYFWAMTALLRGDIDYGYLLIHQAVDEDIKSTGLATPNTPGYALVSLNYERVDQAFRAWVVAQTAFLNDLITNYATTHHRAFTIDDVKHQFIDHPPNVETIFLLTYTIARLRNISGLPRHTTCNPFAGQLELNLLFDITTIIEEAIRHKNPNIHLPNKKTKLTFVHQADFLLQACAHPLNLLDTTGHPITDPLGRINRAFEDNFDTTLTAALNGTLAIQPNAALDSLQCDIALAYGLRNHAAHHTGTAPTIWQRFPDVQQALFRVFCAVIDHLYQ